VKKFKFGDKVKIHDIKKGVIASRYSNTCWYYVLIQKEVDREYSNHKIKEFHIDNLKLLN
jgi:hypothetical protein